MVDASLAAIEGAKLLVKAGYQAIAEGYSVLVMDPVQCSNGFEKWTEFELRKIPARLSTSSVHRFIQDRI